MHYSNNELLTIIGLPAADPLVRQVLADWHIFPNKQTAEGLTFTVDQCGGDGWQGCQKPCAMLLHVGANKVQSLRLWTNAPERLADLCLPYGLDRADRRTAILEGLRANRYLILEHVVPNTLLAYTLFDDRLIYFYGEYFDLYPNILQSYTLGLSSKKGNAKLYKALLKLV
jgi:hypothetical protein